MAAERHFLAFLDRAVVKRVDRFGRVIRQNACFGPRMCLSGSKKINILVSTPKISKKPILEHFQRISYGKRVQIIERILE